MRTFDKLIATIQAGQGSRGLRSPFGTARAAARCVAPAARVAPLFPQEPA